MIYIEELRGGGTNRRNIKIGWKIRKSKRGKFSGKNGGKTRGVGGGEGIKEIVVLNGGRRKKGVKNTGS